MLDEAAQGLRSPTSTAVARPEAMIRVDQLMTTPVLTCRTSDSLHAAAAIMWDHDCGVVPVVDHDGHLCGIVTDRDACMAAYTQGRRLDEIPVGDIMAKRVHSCRPADPVTLAEELMQTHGVRRIPVVDDEGRPVGLLSLNDLARDSSRPGAGQHGMLVAFGRTLAAVCRPRSPKPELPRPPHGWEDYVQKDAS